MSFTERTGAGQSLAMTRIRRAVVWDTVQFAANGVIFVILGEQMPSIMARAAEVVGGHQPARGLVAGGLCAAPSSRPWRRCASSGCGPR